MVEADAKKESVSGDEAWEILSAAATVYVASGQKTIAFVPSEENREELMKRATGRTGNLRAPAVKRKNILYVGYNQEMYETMSR